MGATRSSSCWGVRVACGAAGACGGGGCWGYAAPMQTRRRTARVTTLKRTATFTTSIDWMPDVSFGCGAKNLGCGAKFSGNLVNTYNGGERAYYVPIAATRRYPVDACSSRRD